MSTEPAAPAPAPQTGPETEPESPSTDLAAEVAKWKELSKKNEQRAKANADAAARLTALEESQKTEAQKLADRVAAADAKVAESDAALNRFKVALRHGLSESDIEDLNWSGTDEEVEKRVIRFKERQAKGARPSGTVDQGARGTTTAANPREEFAALFKDRLRT